MAIFNRMQNQQLYCFAQPSVLRTSTPWEERQISLFGFGNDGNLAVRAVPLDDAVFEREQSVVSAHTDVFARADFCAALTDDDVACQNVFAAELLNASALRVRVAPVFCSSLTFFMCHKMCLSYALMDSIFKTESS